MTTGSSPRPDTLYVAVVHGVDGIRAVAGADSRAELVDVLAEYVRERFGHALRADEARHVRGLLARGELEAAVDVYFGLVGRRRGEEWLVTAVVAADDEVDVGIALGAVAHPPNSTGRRELHDPSSVAALIDDSALVS